MASSTILTFAVVALFAAAQQTLPTHTEPMRNTFVTAAETVIDEASALDIHADDVSFRPGFQHAAAGRENLARMAEDDREQEIAAATKDLLFAVQVCHLQAKNGSDTAKCEAQMASARMRSMDALGMHKSQGAWRKDPVRR